MLRLAATRTRAPSQTGLEPTPRTCVPPPTAALATATAAATTTFFSKYPYPWLAPAAPHPHAIIGYFATHTHPTSPRSTGFCAIWGCISSREGFSSTAFHRRAKRSLNAESLLLVRQAQWQWRSTLEGRARKGRGERSFSVGKKGMLRRAATRTQARPRTMPGPRPRRPSNSHPTHACRPPRP